MGKYMRRLVARASLSGILGYERYRRLRLGIRFALGIATETDAADMRLICYDLSGDWPLSYLSVEDVMSTIRDDYGDFPELEDIAWRACQSVWSHWSGDGELSSAAADSAIERVRAIAADCGIDLPERGEFEAAEELTADDI
jgi:hypothetical protein